MKSIIYLTLLQALAVKAVPHPNRPTCSSDLVIENFTITKVIETTVAVPQSTLQDSFAGSEWYASVGTVTPTVQRANGTRSTPVPTIEGTSANLVESLSRTSDRRPFNSVSSPFKTATAATQIATLSSVPPIIESTSKYRALNTTTSIEPLSSITRHSASEFSPTISIDRGNSIDINSTVLLSSVESATASSTSSSTEILKSDQTSTRTSKIQRMASKNIFVPVETDAPPSVIGTRPDHPVPRLGITPQNAPIGTNKFYANFFLGSQTAATWTHPYSVAWAKGGGASQSWGMAISHIDATQRVYGPVATASPVQYFINPVGIQSLVVSASKLGQSTTLSMDNITAFSANVNLLPSAGAAPTITFPLVQGMGFVTAIFNGGTPLLQTSVFFQSITKSSLDPKFGVTKYTIVLNDGKTWMLYAFSADGKELDFKVVNNGLAQATSTFNGIIQIAKNPGGSAEALYDASCGVYATTASLSGNVSGATGSYTLAFEKDGATNATLLMFALPHHLESFSTATAAGGTVGVTSLKLDTTTKGAATAVVADSWTFVEELPTDMGFAPWSPPSAGVSAQARTFSSATISTIHPIALSEVAQNMSQQSNLNSMYYSGKALAKFAGIVYTLHDLLNDVATAQTGLANLKSAFAVFADNKQQYPLVHETAWGGVVSAASYVTGNSGEDFGNTYYNDHHFHYGYFIYAAAVIGYLDPTWLAANKAYVNTLIRDIANPSTEDNYFPVSRNFDWYHGHSWAHGLYETFDGKDEESSSEDSMSAYAIKMWGKVISDANMEARGNLQLAITARSLQHYFLYLATNTVEPPNLIPNKVSGILFENKIDHTTYFGANVEYIQGIHMLPLLPSSTLTRTQAFVAEEWETYFSGGRADAVVGGWKGVLYANYAIVEPQAAWKFFAAGDFDQSWLDGGASRTWYLALAAGLGGAS